MGISFPEDSVAERRHSLFFTCIVDISSSIILVSRIEINRAFLKVPIKHVDEIVVQSLFLYKLFGFNHEVVELQQIF